MVKNGRSDFFRREEHKTDNLEEALHKALEFEAELEGLDVPAGKKALRQRINSGTPMIRMQIEGFESMLRDGTFKTSAMPGIQSSGFKNKTERKKREQEMWPDITWTKEGRPAYGFLGGRSWAENVQWTDQYGPIWLELKGKVKDRSTFSLGDSMGDYPTQADKPQPFHRDAIPDEVALKFARDDWHDYIEMHIFDFNFVKDTKRVVIDRNSWRWAKNLGRPWTEVNDLSNEIYDLIDARIDELRDQLSDYGITSMVRSHDF